MDITLDDLEVIATLGVGGFGRVELVKVMMMMMVMIYSNTINWIKISHCSVATDQAQRLLSSVSKSR